MQCAEQNGELAVIRSRDDEFTVRKYLIDQGHNLVWFGLSFAALGWSWHDGTLLSESGFSSWETAPSSGIGYCACKYIITFSVLFAS